MPPAMTWLVRHGQSASNAGLPAVGAGNVPLTALGYRQARDLAARVEQQPDLLIVSPFIRSQATAAPIRERWPLAPCETWPIHELTYLSPARCIGTTREARQPWVEAYWHANDPDYLDGADAESFRSFMSRLNAFHRRLLALDGELVIAVGHGQFFSGYLTGLSEGFGVAPNWMKEFRAAEIARPIANCEIVELPADAFRQP
jgi:2,3-bisphosphoglycerate-dependent phosphoglycerate mutase